MLFIFCTLQKSKKEGVMKIILTIFILFTLSIIATFAENIQYVYNV